MGHVTEHSRSEFIKKDHLIDADKKNHFDIVPEDRTAVDNILLSLIHI